MSQGHCEGCGETSWLLPLHGPKGGPLRCFKCAGAWNAEYGKCRKAGRVVIKALKVFFDAGGEFSDVERLRLAASGSNLSFMGSTTDTIGTEVGDLTAELLADILKLCHPDRHPPERKELATRITQELLALKPFVFPAPKPEPAQPCDASSNRRSDDLNKPSQPAYPCEDCADTVPYFYCNACKARYDEIQAKKREADERERQAKNARQRERYFRHKQVKAFRTKPTFCACCAEPFKPKRTDALYCSAACRQRAYLKRNGNASNHGSSRRDLVGDIRQILEADPHNAFTIADLCDRLAIEYGQRKDRVAVIAAAKAASEQIGEYRAWWRAEQRGGTLIFWDRRSVMSYALARLKSDWLYKYHGDAKHRAKLETKFKGWLTGEIDHHFRYDKYVVRGGGWWKHCQDDIAKYGSVTAFSNGASVDLTSRHRTAQAGMKSAVPAGRQDGPAMELRPK